MTPLASAELSIFPSQPSPHLLRLDWSGRSDFRRSDEVLAPFLNAALEEAKTTGAEIEMHFERVEFLNSSTIASLVQFLHRARAAGIGLYFTYRHNVRWQRLSFEALKVFEQLDRRIHVVPLAGA